MAEKRTKTIKIRLTPDEYERLLNRKTQATLAGWLRDLGLGQKPKRPVKTIDPKLLYEINRIGVNLNQIAKKCNESAFLTPEEKATIFAYFASISDYLKGILENASEDFR